MELEFMTVEELMEEKARLAQLALECQQRAQAINTVLVGKVADRKIDEALARLPVAVREQMTRALQAEAPLAEPVLLRPRSAGVNGSRAAASAEGGN